MNEPKMGPRGRLGGGKGLLLLFLLIGPIACEQAFSPEGIDTTLKTDTECWEKQGVCITTNWKATGLVHGEKPEMAEIIVAFDGRNTCSPDPEWFRAEDPEMEKLPQEKRPIVYRERAELDCSRIGFRVLWITLKDKHGFELYKYEPGRPKRIEGAFDPTGGKVLRGKRFVLIWDLPTQVKFSVPKVYLKQIKNVTGPISLERYWVMGMKRLDGSVR